MARMTDVRSVGANATVDNVLAGKIYEFAPQNSIVALAATASAVGMRVSLLIGNEVQVDDQEISSANRFPILPDDFVVRGGALRGDRLVLRLRNSTAGALTVNTALDVEPVS
jgi:hypothetical protein